VIDLKGILTYQLPATFYSDKLNDLPRVVSSPLNEAIAATYNIKNFQGLDCPQYFGGGAILYWAGHG
jgi:hypothetical protein